jgi:hypothetical protein
VLSKNKRRAKFQQKQAAGIGQNVEYMEEVNNYLLFCFPLALSTTGRHCAKIGAAQHNAADTAVVSAGYLGSVLLVLRRGKAAAMAAVNRSSVDPSEKSGDSGHEELVPGEVIPFGFTAGPLALPTHQELFILCTENKAVLVRRSPWLSGPRLGSHRPHGGQVSH